MSSFELFVAGRYLRARRKEKVISIVTVISVAGVAAGVMALIIALAVNNGFRNTLQRNLLGATAHVNILEKEVGSGITDWPALVEKFSRIPHVIAVAPVLYDQVFLTGPQNGKGAILKGIETRSELATSDALRHLRSGSLNRLNDRETLPGMIVGAKLAQDTGLRLDSIATVISPQGTLTPFGPQPRSQRFRVVGIFESGFFDFDDNWAYASLGNVQKLLSAGDVVNAIELRLDDLYLAPEIAREAERVAGPNYTSTNWEEQNAQLLHALKMERAVTAVTIGLIILVAALNILITLTMVVLTKYKDIAVLMSMGARRAQIRKIFILQGTIIGLVGTVLGLILGYSLCYFADHYRLIPLDESIYALSFVPFETRPLDGAWISAIALGVSLLATLYPARNATRITPVEVLRYE
jgi:lipoprotein-releasing system permease protein